MKLSHIIESAWFLWHKQLIFFILIWLTSCPVIGQVETKKALSEEDYHLWTHLTREEISAQGNWVSYAIRHLHKPDTLIIQNIKAGVKYKIPEGRNDKFSDDEKWFAAWDVNRQIILLDLESGVRQTIKSQNSTFEFSPNSNYFSVLTPEGLHLQNLKSGEIYNKKDVTTYKWNSEVEIIAFVKDVKTGYSVSLWEPGKDEAPKKVVESKKSRFDGLKWNNSGGLLAFLEADVERTSQTAFIQLYIYNINTKKMVTLDTQNHSEFPRDRVIENNTVAVLQFSEDNNKILFSTKSNESDNIESEKDSDDPDVEVWDAAAAYDYPRMKILESSIKNPEITFLWDFKRNKLQQIGDANYPVTVTNGLQTHAITFSYFDYTPVLLHKEEYTDVFITDLKSGRRKLFLKKQLLYHKVYPSPNGSYFYYFRNQHWWVYDIKNDKHINITLDIQYPFYQLEYDRAGTKPPYGVGGWTKDDEDILIYDQYDIWKINLKKGNKERLTNGRENKTTYKIYQMLYVNYRIFNATPEKVDLNKNLVVEVFNHHTKDEGYSIRKRNGAIYPLAYRESKSSKMRKAKNREVFIYLEERFDLPPRLMTVNLENQNAKIVYQGNPHAFDYHWGKAELVNYTNKNGDSLQGALFYPAQFKPGKKYPMVVSVYEKLSQNRHVYAHPSVYNDDGFNAANLTTQDYFVFYPDIKFQLGDPGLSAADCVVNGVKAVLEEGNVHKDRIGLIGFSFGGYVTSFVITQTDIFRAAVTGSGANNLLGFYLTMGWNYGVPDSFRFEQHQWRMGDSYFNMKSQYKRNCPIQQAENINTPVLAWTGDKDVQVDWQQGIQLYIALRRLEKEHLFLLYRDEAHGLSKPKNQIDLYHRIMHWFDFHLNEE